MAQQTTAPQQLDSGEDTLTDADWAALEQQWRASLPKYTDAELLNIFPEARDIIPEKIAEWQQERAGLVRLIKAKLAAITQKVQPEHRWFWRLCVTYLDGPRLVQVNAHLARLKRLHAVATGRPQAGRLTEAHLQHARAVPVETLVSTPLRRSGKTMVGRCPLHQEKTPSFHVYPASNSWYCFGCQRGGDAIAFTRHLHGLSFPEAVRHLIHATAP